MGWVGCRLREGLSANGNQASGIGQAVGSASSRETRRRLRGPRPEQKAVLKPMCGEGTGPLGQHRVALLFRARAPFAVGTSSPRPAVGPAEPGLSCVLGLGPGSRQAGHMRLPAPAMFISGVSALHPHSEAQGQVTGVGSSGSGGLLRPNIRSPCAMGCRRRRSQPPSSFPGSLGQLPAVGGVLPPRSTVVPGPRAPGRCGPGPAARTASCRGHTRWCPGWAEMWAGFLEEAAFRLGPAA